MERIASQRKLSKHLHMCLDNLGFSKQRRWERIHTMNKCSRANDISTKRILNTNSIEKIFVGSQREGIGLSLLNDLDILQINHDVSCCTDPNLAHENAKVVFKLEHQNAPPGYCFLKLVSQNHEAKPFERIKYALISTQRGQYLSSKVFMARNDDIFLYGEGYFSENTHYKSPKGPSIPKYVDGDFSILKTDQSNLQRSEMDYVRAFPCIADHILQAWHSRKRLFNWPSHKTIAHVMSLPAHVVPVGQTGSAQQDCQWRICFTLAEIHLVQSFNNTQTKLLVLLKLITKYFLKPVCECMTSYVMKTVVLWLAETIPLKKFRRKHLLAMLCDALRFLQTSVKTGHLPNYMIPERNLYAGKLQGHEYELVLAKINYLLQNGQKVIHDFLYNPQQHNNWTDSITEDISVANKHDKGMACKYSVLTVNGLAEYYTTLFLSQWRWMIQLYHIVYVTVPSFYTFCLDVVLRNKRTLEIPLIDKLSSDERQERKALSCCTRKTTHTEPNLDCFIEVKDTDISEILLSGLHYLTLDCVGFISSGVSVFSPFINCSSRSLICYFIIALYALFLVVKVIYWCTRNYSKQTYIKNIENGPMEIKIYTSRSQHKIYKWCISTIICVTIVLNTILAMSIPQEAPQYPHIFIFFVIELINLTFKLIGRKFNSIQNIIQWQTSKRKIEQWQIRNSSVIPVFQDNSEENPKVDFECRLPWLPWSKHKYFLQICRRDI